MRFDTPIYFQRVKAGEFDETTGNYGEDTVTEIKRFASVTNAGTNVLNLIYGEIREGGLVVRLQTHYDAPFDRIRIGKKVYRVDFSRPQRLKQTFIVSEVQ